MFIMCIYRQHVWNKEEESKLVNVNCGVKVDIFYMYYLITEPHACVAYCKLWCQMIPFACFRFHYLATYSRFPVGVTHILLIKSGLAWPQKADAGTTSQLIYVTLIQVISL